MNGKRRCNTHTDTHKNTHTRQTTYHMREDFGKGLKAALAMENVRGQHDCQVSALGIKRARRIRETIWEGEEMKSLGLDLMN